MVSHVFPTILQNQFRVPLVDVPCRRGVGFSDRTSSLRMFMVYAGGSICSKAREREREREPWRKKGRAWEKCVCVCVYIYIYIYIDIYMIQVRPSCGVVWCGCARAVLHCSPLSCGVVWCGCVRGPAPTAAAATSAASSSSSSSSSMVGTPINPLYCGVLCPPPLWCGVAAPPVVRPLLQQQRQYPQVRSLHSHKDRLCLTVDGFGFDS